MVHALDGCWVPLRRAMQIARSSMIVRREVHENQRLYANDNDQGC